MRVALISCTAFVLFGCGYDDFDSGETETDIEPEQPLANIHISYLKMLYDKGAREIEDDAVVSCKVTANDLSGNFYRSFIIQDADGALEVRAGFYDLHSVYGEGRRVVISLKGLCIGMYNGILQLGRTVNDYSSYRVEEFESANVLSDYVWLGEIEPAQQAEKKEIADLSLNDCGRLVSVGRVLFARDTTAYWAYGDALQEWYSNAAHKFKDVIGDSLLVVTSSYCDFADQRVPTDSVRLTGILMYGQFNGSKPMFALKLRDLNDVSYE